MQSLRQDVANLDCLLGFLSKSVTSAGGFIFFQQVFEHSLNSKAKLRLSRDLVEVEDFC